MYETLRISRDDMAAKYIDIVRRVWTRTKTAVTVATAIGFAHDQLGDHIAMPYFNQALKINPRDVYASDGMGSALIALKNFSGAIQYLYLVKKCPKTI